MSYDSNNIFAKIIRGDLTCNLFKEHEMFLAFHDINPQDRIHIIVIPKKHYINYKDFCDQASDSEKIELLSFLNECTKDFKTYSLVTNSGKYQEIPHFHIHIKTNGDQN